MIAEGTKIRYKSEAEGGPKGDAGLECVYTLRTIISDPMLFGNEKIAAMTSESGTKFYTLLKWIKEAE